MFRKTAIALAAFASLGTISLAPTAADAGYFSHHHHYRHFHYTPRVWVAPTYVAATECVWVKKWTHYGPKFFKVCDYH